MGKRKRCARACLKNQLAALEFSVKAISIDKLQRWGIIIRIYAEPLAHNTASCRVLEKAGFEFEGTLRNNAIKNGEIVDMKMYAR